MLTNNLLATALIGGMFGVFAIFSMIKVLQNGDDQEERFKGLMLFFITLTFTILTLVIGGV